MNLEIIEELCHMHTALGDEEIQCIKQMALSLPGLAAGSSSGVDFFIDCPCVDASEAVVVAQESAQPSLYAFSTVGYIIQEDAEPAVFRSLRLGIETEEVKAVTMATTQQHSVVQTVRPILRGGKTIGVLIVEREYQSPEETMVSRQLTARPTEEELEKYPYLRNIDWLAGCIHDAVIVVDEAGIVCYRNAEAARIYMEYGYIYDIFGLEYQKVACHGDLLHHGTARPEAAEISIRGSFYRIEQTALEEAGRRFTLTVLHDVTAQRRRAQAELAWEASVQEAHHRIKNSLNMIYSLLDMQRRRCQDAASAEGLQMAMDRIISVSTAYEMSSGKSLDSVSLFQVMIHIKDHFTQLAMETGKSLNITVQGSDIAVSTDVSSAVALVVSELLQNAYKHAFPSRVSGNIHIELKNSPVYSRISVSDDGVGFDPEKRGNGTGIGYRIVQMLVSNNLGGKLEVKSDGAGTKVTFGFRCEK